MGEDTTSIKSYLLSHTIALGVGAYLHAKWVSGDLQELSQIRCVGIRGVVGIRGRHALWGSVGGMRYGDPWEAYAV